MMIVIYHKSCHDGFCAAWLLHKLYPNATFVPMQHGDDPPTVEGHDVIVADFSFDLATTQKMIADSKSWICFDHHKSVAKQVLDLPEVVFDENKSGARLVWEHFRRDLKPLLGLLDYETDFDDKSRTEEPIPWLVRYTEDRDLWRFHLPGSRQVNSGMRLVPFEFDAWDDLTFGNLYSDGIVLERYFRHRSEAASKRAVSVYVRGADGAQVAVPMVNETNPDCISLVGEILCQAPDVPFGMTYFLESNTQEFVYSLRSRDDYDVSEVAKYYGGGGHKNAAGFRWPILFFKAM